MRRLLVIATATALFMSVAVGMAGAELYEYAWPGKVTGSMIATDGFTVDLRAVTRPTEDNWTKAHGSAYHEFDGNAFRLRITHACVDEDNDTVTAWGVARVTAGSFDGGNLVRGDKAHAALSLRDDGSGIVSGDLSIAATWDDAIPVHIAVYCQWPTDGTFPIGGEGIVDFVPK